MIICGVDFSESSLRAARVAAGLAVRTDNRLELFHVLDAERPPRLAGARLDDAKLAERDVVRAKELSLLARELMSANAGLHVETRLAHDGRPDVLLCERARDAKAAVLVVGEVGEAGRDAEVGSVAERCVLHAKVPVLLVRKGEGDLAAKLQAGGALRITLAIDGSHASDVALEEIRTLRARMSFDLDLVRLYWPPAERERLGLPASVNVLAGDARISDAIRDELEKRLGKLPGSGRVSFHVLPSWGPVGDALADCAKQLGADMMVVGCHQRHGVERVLHGSVSRELIGASRVPLLIVPAAAEAPPMERHLVRPRRVLVPTDFSPLAVAALPHAYGVLGRGGRVELVHVIETSRFKATTEELATMGDPELERRLESLVPDEAVREGISTRTHLVVAPDAAQGICQLAERLNVDLICIATHGRGGMAGTLLGSTAKEVVAQARRPVLLVRGPRD